MPERPGRGRGAARAHPARAAKPGPLPAKVKAKPTAPARGRVPRALEPSARADHSVRDLRRRQIVEAARALVAEGGLEALTMSALEARLSFTRGVITYHFVNKDEIVREVLESAVEEIDEAIARAARDGLAEGGFAGVVRAVLRATVRGYVDHPEAGRVLMSFWGRLDRDPAARERNARLYATYRAQARAMLEAGRGAGAIGPEHDPEPVAALLVGIVLGIATQVYFDPGAIDPDAVADEAARAVLARLTAPPS